MERPSQSRYLGSSTVLSSRALDGFAQGTCTIETEGPAIEGIGNRGQVVQWVNICYAVYDKATGNLIAGPFAGNQFWAGFGGVCQINNDGDIIIQWDKANHVWVASQNVFGPFTTCIAVSKTNDATGAFNRFQFSQPGFPDYHKFGLAPHAYYQTQNDFGTGSAYVGVNVCAYDADGLRSGSKRSKQVCFLDNSNGTLFDDSMLPADTDQDPPTAGPAPEVLLGSIDNSNPGSNVYQYVFTVAFKGKGKATLAGINGSLPISVPSYSLGCGGFGACIQQPTTANGTPEPLDALGDRLMYRLALFDDGTNQHFLVNHSVNDTAGAVGARWYEFTAPTGLTRSVTSPWATADPVLPRAISHQSTFLVRLLASPLAPLIRKFSSKPAAVHNSLPLTAGAITAAWLWMAPTTAPSGTQPSTTRSTVRSSGTHTSTR